MVALQMTTTCALIHPLQWSLSLLLVVRVHLLTIPQKLHASLEMNGRHYQVHQFPVTSQYATRSRRHISSSVRR